MQTFKLLYRLRSQDIAYLRTTIESYDGMAVVKTIDPRAALVEIQVSPGCENLVHGILDHLATHENIPLAPIELSEPDQPESPI
jgi:hypothetical protein